MIHRVKVLGTTNSLALRGFNTVDRVFFSCEDSSMMDGSDYSKFVFLPNTKHTVSKMHLLALFTRGQEWKTRQCAVFFFYRITVRIAIVQFWCTAHRHYYFYSVLRQDLETREGLLPRNHCNVTSTLAAMPFQVSSINCKSFPPDGRTKYIHALLSELSKTGKSYDHKYIQHIVKKYADQHNLFPKENISSWKSLKFPKLLFYM